MLSKKRVLAALSVAALLIFPALTNIGQTHGVLRLNAALENPSHQTPINSATWRTDSRILAIRKITAAVASGLKRHSFKVSARKFEYCEPYQDTLRRIALDHKGVARSYIKEAGSDDSSLKWEHFYDTAGRLRFVFISGGAVNGSELEHRIYFDEAGERLWEEQKYIKGPGYTFPEKWPDEELQKTDPLNAFNATSPCREVGPRRRPKLT
jgi:hypothetical protein